MTDHGLDEKAVPIRRCRFSVRRGVEVGNGSTVDVPLIRYTHERGDSRALVVTPGEGQPVSMPPHRFSVHGGSPPLLVTRASTTSGGEPPFVGT